MIINKLIISDILVITNWGFFVYIEVTYLKVFYEFVLSFIIYIYHNLGSIPIYQINKILAW